MPPDLSGGSHRNPLLAVQREADPSLPSRTAAGKLPHQYSGIIAWISPEASARAFHYLVATEITAH